MPTRTSLLSRVFDVFNFILLLAFFFITLYPFYYIFIYTISDPAEAAKGGVFFLPAGFTLSNYVEVFRLEGIARATLVSTARTLIGTAVTLFCCSFAAYLVTKERLRFRKAIYRFIIVTMYLEAGLIPWYLTMQIYGLSNNFLLYIIPSAVQAYFVILLKTYFESIPAALEESAALDGAGYITRFLRIVLPMSTPILATIIVFAAVNQWNTWYDNYFLVRDESLMTLQLLLKTYLDQINYLVELLKNGQGSVDTTNILTPTAVRMTVTMVITIPILCVYPFMQRFFVKGLLMGAVKG